MGQMREGGSLFLLSFSLVLILCGYMIYIYAVKILGWLILLQKAHMLSQSQDKMIRLFP